MSIDEEIDRLYGLPLDEFTGARDASAKQVRAAGDRDGAQRIKALKKPNLAAWALNQLARRLPDDIEDLFEVTERVRNVQRSVMSGGRGDLRAVTDERNRVVMRLAKLAAVILAETEHAAAPQTLSAISDSLIAMASDEEGAELFRGGRLVRELKPGAVINIGVLSLVPEQAEESEEPATLRIAIDTRALRDAVETAKRRVDEATRALQEAEDDARRVSEEAEFAKRSVDARKAEADEAVKALADAHQALQEADRS